MELRDYTQLVRDVCLDEQASEGDVGALAGDAARWLRYRRMVRRRLSDVVRAALPRFGAELGEARFDAAMDGFLASSGLRSPHIRDVPGEMLAWLCEGGATDALALPPHALDLASLEWAERAVLYAEDDVEDVAPLAMSSKVVLTRAHRLLALTYPVHALEPGRVPAPRPTWLCVYRDRASFEARVLQTNAVTHALLASLSVAPSLEAAITAAASRASAPVDAAFLEALSEVLADLVDRGVVRGAPG